LVPAVECLGNDPKRLDNVLSLLREPFQVRRDEGTWIVDFTGEQHASLVLAEVEVGPRHSGVPEYFRESCSVPRGVLANVHDGEVEPEDLGQADSIVEITVGDQICTLGAQ
jgi:hypothetical protein